MHPLSRYLLSWYDRHRRILPWRALPGMTPDPYHVWLSEIMLQQTTVQAVKPYFDTFITRWPTVEALAKADRDHILDAWAGLGYYARARNLHACAGEVVERFGGRFPDEVASLKSLPGIGDYTAGAVAAIAFNKKAVAVDGNVERVISRLYRIETPLPAAKKIIKQKTAGLVPDRAGDFAQALMDLGAGVCLPRKPNCIECPWQDFCAAHKNGDMDRFPVKAPKKDLPIRYGVAFWLEADGHVLLRRRPSKGLLGGMLEVPTSPWTDKKVENIGDIFDYAPVRLSGLSSWRPLKAEARHTFTHFHLRLGIVAARLKRPEPSFGLWYPVGNLAALPTLMRKVAALAQDIMAEH